MLRKVQLNGQMSKHAAVAEKEWEYNCLFLSSFQVFINTQTIVVHEL